MKPTISTMKTFYVFILRYARDEVRCSGWRRRLVSGGFETSGTRARGVGAAVGTFEGVAAAVLAGEDYLVIASDTKQHARVAHSVFIEQKVGY